MNPATWAEVFAPFRCLCACLLGIPVIILVSLQPAMVRYVAGAQSPLTLYTPSGYYVSSYDYLDVGHLLKNEKLVTAYIKCFVGEGACTTEGRQVKAVLLPEIIRTVCSKCTPRQKNMARQVLKHIYYKRRSDFERIMAIYDTEGKYNEIILFMNQK